MSQSITILPLHVFDAVNLRDPRWRSTELARRLERHVLFGPFNIGDPTMTNIQEPYTLVPGATARVQNWYATTDMSSRGEAFEQWAHWTMLTVRVRGLAYATRSIHDLLQRRSGQTAELSNRDDSGDSANEMLEHRHLDELARTFYTVHERTANEHGFVDWATLAPTRRKGWMDVAAEAKKKLCVAPVLTVPPRMEFFVEIHSNQLATAQMLESLTHDDRPAAVWIHLEGFSVFSESVIEQ